MSPRAKTNAADIIAITMIGVLFGGMSAIVYLATKTPGFAWHHWLFG